MADIQLRFHNDMLVLSSPADAQLARLGVNVARDNELVLLLEPEVLDEVYALEAAAGAQCVVTNTAFMTPAQLAKSRMNATGTELAQAALRVARGSQEYGTTPQHVLVEIGPCRLPLDASSKASLNENRDQYARAAGFFAELEPLFDTYFLNGFDSCVDLKCALMGMRKVTDKPIFASVVLGERENDVSECESGAGKRESGAGDPASKQLTRKGESIDEAVAVMAEYGAQVAGFETAAPPEVAAELAKKAVGASVLPVLAQLHVRQVNPEQKSATPENPYFEPDTMIEAAEALKAAGAQFLRASGNATSSYAGALVAATLGDAVERPDKPAHNNVVVEQAELDELAQKLRARISSALGKNQTDGEV